MYEAFFGFSKRPFSLTPDPEFLFWADHHRRAFDMISMSLLRHAPIALVTGEIGSGKTTLIQELLREISSDFEIALLSNVVGDSGDLLRWILTAFGHKSQPSTPAEALREVEAHVRGVWAEGRRSILIVDEAQNVSDSGIETLRLLTNLDVGKAAPLSLVLVGQPELRDRLRGDGFVAFRQRLGASCHLGPMTLEETSGYIRRRLEIAGGSPELFAEGAVEVVFRRSRGVPRLTNLLCDLCLVAAFGEDRMKIDEGFAEGVLAECLASGGLGGLPAEAVGEEVRQAVLRVAPAGHALRPEQSRPFPVRTAPSRSQVRSPAPALRIVTPDSPEPPRSRPTVPVEPAEPAPIQLAPEVTPAPDLPAPCETEAISSRGHAKLQHALGSIAGLAVAASAAAAALVFLAGPTDSGHAAQSASADPALVPAAVVVKADSGKAARTSAVAFALPKAELAPSDPAGAEVYFRRALEESSNTREAMIDYSRAAARGHPRAAYYLAQLYETGDGVAFAPSTAAAWYSEVASEVPGAAKRIEDLAEVPGHPEPYVSPSFASAENGILDLVWEGRGTFVVELASDPGEAPSASISTPLTAVRIVDPGDVAVWRVRPVGGTPSEWAPVGAGQDG